MTIPQNLASIRQQISETAQKAGRSAEAIQLVCVSKKKSPEMILEALASGSHLFGENYVQELIQKQNSLKDESLSWHFVGHLQRRKVKDIIGKVDLIHSLDSYQLAYEIEKQASQKDVVQKCLIQLNLSNEESKHGVTQEEVGPLLQGLKSMHHLDVVGLMTMPFDTENSEEVRPFFKFLFELKELLNSSKVYRHELTELSMGMSHDFKVAIEEGATIIRIGSAIFGERNSD